MNVQFQNTIVTMKFDTIEYTYIIETEDISVNYLGWADRSGKHDKV